MDLVSDLFSIFPQDQVHAVWLLYRNNTKTAYWMDKKWELEYESPPTSFSERLQVINGSLWLTNLRERDDRLEVKFQLEPKNRTGHVQFYKTRLFVTDPVGKSTCCLTVIISLSL